MPRAMISKTITLMLRGFQALMAVIIMALAGHMISTSGWNQLPRHGGNAAEVNYAIFLSVFALLWMLVFVPVALSSGTDKELAIAVLVGDGLLALFYMCGGIALAAAMNIHSCENSLYTENNRITNSSPDTHWRCREAQATTAFVWFSFVSFGVTIVTSTLAYQYAENGEAGGADGGGAGGGRRSRASVPGFQDGEGMMTEETRPKRGKALMDIPKIFGRHMTDIRGGGNEGRTQGGQSNGGLGRHPSMRDATDIRPGGGA
ncbi:hypothetical protein GP486_002066 [Trichoglossum hirsutum]|uniref:MARVEL domain-containing protein n=1 Tax=Trichoglossum hirsutum TaxID=265104 RepID=A0A9P8RS23_9PEZI|nr:hypothetical protein GP486_002066 [Trichoglossum hirsutum]